jgi:hypothetical protein
MKHTVLDFGIGDTVGVCLNLVVSPATGIKVIVSDLGIRESRVVEFLRPHEISLNLIIRHVTRFIEWILFTVNRIIAFTRCQ